MVDVPGGSSGILCRDYKGKEADRLVTRIATGAVSRVAELRGRERHAEELEQWKTHHEERWVIDASPAAIRRALLLTDQELDSMEKRDGDGEIAGRGRPGGSDVASPQPAARYLWIMPMAPPEVLRRFGGKPLDRQRFPANSAGNSRQSRVCGVFMKTARVRHGTLRY